MTRMRYLSLAAAVLAAATSVGLGRVVSAQTPAATPPDSARRAAVTPANGPTKITIQVPTSTMTIAAPPPVAAPTAAAPASTKPAAATAPGAAATGTGTTAAGTTAAGTTAAGTTAAGTTAAANPVTDSAAAGAIPVGAMPTAPAGPAPLFPLERVVAIVGDQPVLWSNVLEAVNVRRAQGLQIPADSIGQAKVVADVTNDLIDEELLVQKAKDLKVEVTDDDVAAGVDSRVKQVRVQFNSEVEYRTELKKAGFGTPEEWRKVLIEQAKRQELQRKVIDKLKEDGKLLPASVSEADVDQAFEKNRDKLPRKPAEVTFRQIVIAPHPSVAAKAAAHAKADSILATLKKGGDFAEIAKRESMDPGTRQQGGDLGWNRRGAMVKEFEAWMFALAPGQMSPVIETPFGYHIIRVDRVKPGEVKASHILIRWNIDSGQVALAELEADSVLTRWRNGAKFDSLVARYHDQNEEKGALVPWPRDSLPPSYQQAFAGKGQGDFVGPFRIADKVNNSWKFVVSEIIASEEGGDYTKADLRQQIRDQLQQEKSIRRLLDGLRKETYVSLRLDAPPVTKPSPAPVS